MTLLAMRVYVFMCNAPRCEEDTAKIPPPNVADGARSAWRVAKTLGWTRRGRTRTYASALGAGHPGTAVRRWGSRC